MFWPERSKHNSLSRMSAFGGKADIRDQIGRRKRQCALQGVAQRENQQYNYPCTKEHQLTYCTLKEPVRGEHVIG